MEEKASIVAPDAEGFIPGDGGDQGVVGAETDPHDGVAVCGQCQPGFLFDGVPDADVPLVVAV